jgi:hypothetical protein
MESDQGAGTTARRKFADMSGSEKLKHLGKVLLFFCTLGFAFPTIISGE